MHASQAVARRSGVGTRTGPRPRTRARQIERRVDISAVGETGTSYRVEFGGRITGSEGTEEADVQISETTAEGTVRGLNPPITDTWFGTESVRVMNTGDNPMDVVIEPGLPKTKRVQPGQTVSVGGGLLQGNLELIAAGVLVFLLLGGGKRLRG